MKPASTRRCRYLLFCGGLLAVLLPNAGGWLTPTVERAAEEIEEKLINFITSVTGLDVLEQAYNDSRSRITFQSVNGKDLVVEVAQSFGDVFRRRIEALQLSLKRAKQLSKKYQWKPKIVESDVHYIHARGAFNESFEFSEQYGRPVSLMSSSAHIPVDIYRGDVEILNSLAWTGEMDQIWKENKERDPGLLWQYFGSQSGVLKVYPASKWRRQKDSDLYDVRRRPWYTEGASSPKEMLILVDRSGSSHGQALSLMKHSVKSILETIGENDYVNVANFSEKASWVGCFSTLVQANQRNKQLLAHSLCQYSWHSEDIILMWLSAFVDTVTAGGVASYATGLEFAFQQLENFTWTRNQNYSGNDGEGGGGGGDGSCNKMIMFLTDGGTEMPVDVIRKYNANKTVRIFSFAIGPVANAIPAVKWLGCSNRGYFYQIPAMGAVRSKVQDYHSYLARPQALAPGGHFTTSVHLDELGMGLVASVTVPVFNESQDIGNQSLLGILGVDISLMKLIDSLPRQKFGPGGYAFAINSNGYVVFHPELKITESSHGSHPSIDFVEIEDDTQEKQDKLSVIIKIRAPIMRWKGGIVVQHTFEPAQSRKIRRDMIDQKLGHKVTRSYVAGLDDKHADVKERAYYYSPIPNTNFSLAIVVPEYYKVYIESLNIDMTTMHHLQLSDMKMLLEYKRYCHQLQNASMTIDTFMSFLQANYTLCNVNEVRHLLFDAEIVSKLHQYWLRQGSLPDGVVGIAVETNSGLTLIYPLNGTAFNFSESTLNPWDRVHYKRAAETNIWIYSPLIKSDGNFTEKFIMASKAVTLSSNNYRIAVMNIMMTYQKFYEIILSAINIESSKLVYVIDDGGFILYSNKPDSLQCIGDFFGLAEPSVMADLKEKKLFISRKKTDYQCTCSTKGMRNSALRIFPTFLYQLLSIQWWSSTSSWAYFQIYSWLFSGFFSFSSSQTLEEEIIAEHSHRTCIMEIPQYHFNLEDGFENVKDGAVSCSNCTRRYQASQLHRSNLLLVVIESAEDCKCNINPLPYQPKEVKNPITDQECYPNVRYHRKLPCFDSNPNEVASYCTGCSPMMSWRLFLFSLFAALLIIARHRVLR